jgi:hypothetical protein
VRRTNLYYVSQISRRINRSRDKVRRDIDSGELPALRMPNGTRIVEEVDADRYVRRFLDAHPSTSSESDAA